MLRGSEEAKADHLPMNHLDHMRVISDLRRWGRYVAISSNQSWDWKINIHAENATERVNHPTQVMKNLQIKVYKSNMSAML